MAYFNRKRPVLRRRFSLAEYQGKAATPESVEAMCTEIDQNLQEAIRAWERRWRARPMVRGSRRIEPCHICLFFSKVKGSNISII